ncbi:ATP-binding protein [Hymenobacter tibetensis]|uniref:histidine kinase n=1 Tax=Hymenobacter tibetensis TaxID=497967 RepID=A0ABY4CT11_9BACT|nr:ATP-binding protein [Hymenobacter tibetensis]UOG73400.1 ATP-binding protein [Hymenobacter tibetensis]
MAHLLPADPTVLPSITAFQGLPPDVLTWLLQAGHLRHYADGEVIVQAGAPADRLLAVVRGGTHTQLPGAPSTRGFRLEVGDVGGLLPYSRLEFFPAQGLAVGDTVLFELPRSQFATLEQVSPELVQRLIGVMNDRARDLVRTQERDDKLRALGKLSAGLSHELNNPAAAISRAADSLTTALHVIPARLIALLATCPPAETLATITALAVLPAELPRPLSALQAADREDELADWLETQGCPDGAALAPSLLDAGLDAAALTPVAARLPANTRPAAFAWLSGHLTAARLTRDISEASRRISTLVDDVKTYSHMDRAGGREKLAVTTGLDSTLHLYAHALRQKNVRLTRDYSPDLPLVLGQAGSLNQVWTNLIDNALDAMPATGGELTLRVDRQGSCLVISVEDNGTGITTEVLAHMFEPFYTTKPLGEGSGLGLDIARRIVQEHGGRLEAVSRPGCTKFTVWLPLG